MKNPSHLISTLQRVFWAGAVQGWAASPKQVSGGGCPQACGRAEIQHFGKGWMRISHPSRDGAGIGLDSLISCSPSHGECSLLMLSPLGFSTGEKVLPRKSLFSQSLAKPRLEPFGSCRNNAECQPAAPVHTESLKQHHREF